MSSHFQRATPIEHACIGGHVDCIKAFLAAGVSVVCDEPGKSSLLILAAQHGQAAALEFLLQAKSDISAKNVSGSDFLSFPYNLKKRMDWRRMEPAEGRKGSDEKEKKRARERGGGGGRSGMGGASLGSVIFWVQALVLSDSFL
jgi:hypothetical protein